MVMKLQKKAILRAHNRSMVTVHLFEIWMCGTLFSNLKGTCFVSKRRAWGKTKARNDIHWQPLTDIFWIMSLSTSLRAWAQSQLLTKYQFKPQSTWNIITSVKLADNIETESPCERFQRHSPPWLRRLDRHVKQLQLCILPKTETKKNYTATTFFIVSNNLLSTANLKSPHSISSGLVPRI